MITGLTILCGGGALRTPTILAKNKNKKQKTKSKDSYFIGWNRPICRTVSDAVYVLDAIVGFDYNDAEATREASKYIPPCGYKQFLKADGLKGKRLGIVRNPFFIFPNGSVLTQAFERHFDTLR